MTVVVSIIANARGCGACSVRSMLSSRQDGADWTSWREIIISQSTNRRQLMRRHKWCRRTSCGWRWNIYCRESFSSGNKLSDVAWHPTSGYCWEARGWRWLVVESTDARSNQIITDQWNYFVYTEEKAVAPYWIIDVCQAIGIQCKEGCIQIIYVNALHSTVAVWMDWEYWLD